MTTRKFSVVALLVLVGLFSTIPSLAQDNVLVELDDMRPERLAVGGFVLDSDQEIDINAIGFKNRKEHDDVKLCSAWILDTKTREVVWELADAKSKGKGRRLREYNGEVKLPAGRYEVYFSTFAKRNNDFENGGLDALVSLVKRGNTDGYDKDDYRRASRDFHITIKGHGQSLNRKEIVAYHDELAKDALISAVRLEDNVYESFAITLDQEMDLDIYAIGEMNKDTDFDVSWIVDTKTNERVWSLDYRRSDRAGGVKKNRVARETISLPAGSYALFCVTDDSHHCWDWNSRPPYDPFFWGTTIRLVDSHKSSYVTVGEYEKFKPANIVVEMTGLGDSDYQKFGFTLQQDLNLRVYGIGEGKRKEMYDYSWIIDADTREVVWEMKYRDSDHAGGAEKNRIVEEMVELDKGNYIAYAVTDDSHSSDKWRSSPPYDQERWGLTISVADGESSYVGIYNESENNFSLAQLVDIGDNDLEKKRFSLDRDSEVRIYALGEGSRGGMNDYAWIEDDRGDAVWEMEYRKTDHAGGDKKNRVFNDTMKLDAGEYTLLYKSDGSHSAHNWNATPPDDRWNWGVQVKIEE